MIAPASEAEAGLGESAGALRLYEQAFEGRSPNMVYAKTYQLFVPEVAGDARYKAILARMNFPSLAE